METTNLINPLCQGLGMVNGLSLTKSVFIWKIIQHNIGHQLRYSWNIAKVGIKYQSINHRTPWIKYRNKKSYKIYKSVGAWIVSSFVTSVFLWWWTTDFYGILCLVAAAILDSWSTQKIQKFWKRTSKENVCIKLLSDFRE